MPQKWLFFNSRDELQRIEVSRIVYFEADGNYTVIVMAGNMRTTVYMNLSAMEKVLADNLKEQAHLFARIGKRFIINLNCVYQLSILRRRLVLSDLGTCTFNLEVSKEALKNLKEIMVKIKI